MAPLTSQKQVAGRRLASAVFVRFGLPLAVALPLMIFADQIVPSSEESDHTLCTLRDFSLTCEYVEHPPTYGPRTSAPLDIPGGDRR